MNDRQHETSESSSASQDAAQDAAHSKPRIDWDNPNTLAGDAPPMPRWPLMISIVVYAGWLVFLVVMAYMRIKTTAQ